MNMSLQYVAHHAGLSFNPTQHVAKYIFSTPELSRRTHVGDGQQDARTQTILPPHRFTLKSPMTGSGATGDTLDRKIAEKFYPYDFTEDEMNS